MRRNFSPLFPPTAEAFRQADLRTAETRHKGHGRREHRRLESSTRLAGKLDWPGLAQVCRLTRTTSRQGQTSQEVAYAISSVPRELGCAAQLLGWWRGHWGIENRLHWVRDTAWREDHCRVRRGFAPQNLAAFRNAALGFLHLSGRLPVRKTLRHYARKLPDLLASLGILDF